MLTTRAVLRLLLITALAIGSAVAALPNPAAADPQESMPTTCAQMPAKLLGGDIKYANAQLVPANTAPGPQLGNFTGTPPSSTKISVAYCLVVLSYSSTPPDDPTPQNITIYVGLPLNSMDGGITGSPTVPSSLKLTTVEGNWMGRTNALGGAGCTGENINGFSTLEFGLVGSATDGGHVGTGSPDDCEPGVISLGRLNYQFIKDWYYTGVQQQVLWEKKVVKLYYGKAAVHDYWSGCSTGGRQGYALAQTLPGELDGIIANSPTLYWTRQVTADMWGQIAMYDIAHEVIAAGKLAAAQNGAIAACDTNDGVADGIIDDPRTCTFNAKANICGRSGAPAAPNCLTETEADALNVMWDGPRNDSGKRIWFPFERGTDLTVVDANAPDGQGTVQFGWDLENPAYYNGGVFPNPYPGFWGNVALNSRVQPVGAVTTYAAVAQAGSRNVADFTDTFGNLDEFRARGGKLVTVVGGNDEYVPPRGVINYYRLMAARYAKYGDDPSDRYAGIQKFYRLFHAPGVGHCGDGIQAHQSLGPWPQFGDDFWAMVNWVETGVAPTGGLRQTLSELQGEGNTAVAGFTNGSPTELSRPLCPYPQTAVYNGTGNVNDAANWQCGGDLDNNVPVGTPLSGPPGLPVACYDVLVEYKHEVDGPLDYEASGVDPAVCGAPESHRPFPWPFYRSPFSTPFRRR